MQERHFSWVEFMSVSCLIVALGLSDDAYDP